ncbi:MAG: helix-turn-helix domain-containing protein [Flavobacteriales bacterium]
MKHRLPKILKINRIERGQLRVSVLFSNGQNRLLDFDDIFRNKWKVKKKDPESLLLDPKEFAKVQLNNYTLSWSNVPIHVTSNRGKMIPVAFEVGADTLLELSIPDENNHFSIGSIFRKARLSANLSQEEVAARSGTSRTYITKLESGKSDVELMTLKKLVEAGLNMKLQLEIK